MNGAVLVVLIGLGGLVWWVFKVAGEIERSNEARSGRKLPDPRQPNDVRAGTPPK